MYVAEFQPKAGVKKIRKKKAIAHFKAQRRYKNVRPRGHARNEEGNKTDVEKDDGARDGKSQKKKI